MIDINEITIKEFKDNIYDRYIEIFPEKEQREWEYIEKAYDKNIEKFYEIKDGKIVVGFIILEKIDKMPYYIDYFAIYNEYQNKGYGTKAIKLLIDDVIGNNGLCAEVESIEYSKDAIDKDIRLSRINFYKRLDFILGESIYNLYGVYYTPIIHTKENISKEELDNIFFSYYNFNCGIEEVKNNCEIIK